jgi:hypothetical protein
MLLGLVSVVNIGANVCAIRYSMTMLRNTWTLQHLHHIHSNGAERHVCRLHKTRRFWRTKPQKVIHCRWNVLPIDRPTDTRFQQFLSILTCIRCRGNVFTEPLRSNVRNGTFY